MKNITTHYETDIVVIGAGPAGLSFCRSMADSGLRIALVDPNSAETLSSPPVDGREVSIIRNSERLLTDLGAWQHIADDDKFALKSAKVFNGNSDYSLNFPAPKNDRGILGYFVPNHRIRQALFKAIQQQDNLSCFYENKVSSVNTTDESACVTLQNGEKINAKLVVSADSRYSDIRKTMGIATNIRDFGRTVIIFRMKHTQSNHHIAMECFHYGRTMAVLPLGEYMSSIVITIDSSQADALMNLDTEQTSVDVMEQLKGQLGDMTLVSEKHYHPLVGVHAQQFYAKRYVLIGDTAVGMHPVTAQGFNLGLQSQSILSKLLKEATHKQQDIGSERLLMKYNRKHKLSTTVLYHGTNAIVKLFSTDDKLVKPLRHFVLRAGNNFYPFKKLISKRLAG